MGWLSIEKMSWSQLKYLKLDKDKKYVCILLDEFINYPHAGESESPFVVICNDKIIETGWIYADMHISSSKPCEYDVKDVMELGISKQKLNYYINISIEEYDFLGSV